MRLDAALLALIALGLAAPAAVLAQTAPLNPASRQIAANCANCHGTQGRAQGAMPSLAGMPRDTIIEQMKAFRDGKRPGTIMPQLAKGYTDEQIALAADYFSRQPATR